MKNNMGQMTFSEFSLSFLPNKHYKIICMSACYDILMIVARNELTDRTKVYTVISTSFGINRDGYNYSAAVEKHSSVIVDLKSNKEQACTWLELKDFESILHVDENIVYTSCAAYACTFISDKGRIFASGSNQFGECARKKSPGGSHLHAIQECDIDFCEEGPKPFFVKSRNGDHTIIALTRTGDVYCCGYRIKNLIHDLCRLEKFHCDSMDKGEYFVDVASQFYSFSLLTSK